MTQSTPERMPCGTCGKECSINADGTVRHHLTDNPDWQAGPDSRKCSGAGQPPAGAAGVALAEDMTASGPQCRLCKHPVELTSNGRVRSHITPEATPRPCPGGSDFPLGTYPDMVGTTDGLVASLAADCGHVPAGQCYGCHGAAGGPVSDAEGTGTAPWGIAPETVAQPTMADQLRSTPLAEALARETAGVGTVLDAMSPDTRTQAERFLAAGVPEQPTARVEHVYTDPSGVEWRHPGTEESCRTPECGEARYRASLPEGFDPRCAQCNADSHRCPGCGASVPHGVIACGDCTARVNAEKAERQAACTHPDGFRGTISVHGREVPACEHCDAVDNGGAREPQTGPVRLGDLDEGDYFVRRGTLMRLTERESSSSVLAEVVDGPHKGRTGELKNPDEMVERAPEPRNTEQETKECTDDRTATRQPRSSAAATPRTTTAPAPGSRQPSTESARAVLSESTSTTQSAPTVQAAGNGRSAAVTTDQSAAAAAFLGGGRPAAPAPTGQANPADAAAQFLAGGSGAHGEKETRRDRFGRYLIPHPDTGKEQAWTRSTTFAKSISDTYALSQWGLRMALLGATQRPDIVQRAHGKHVRADKKLLDELTAELKTAAGDKVAANLGTSMHSFTEMADRAWHSPGGPRSILDQVPPDCRDDVETYIRLLEETGLEPVPNLIEFTTVVKQYGVAGTSDNCYKVTKPLVLRIGRGDVRLEPGEYVIGDKKGLALTEKIPTPDGWTTMGEIQVGDTVFDAYGKPCEVLEKSQIKRIGTYVVKFDDGSSVVCDSEHIWWTAAGYRPGEPEARGIAEVIATLENPRTGQKQHRVPVAGPLDLPEADLPIDPYLLGCWLGDGASRGGTITKGRDLFEILAFDGHSLGVEQAEKGDCVTRTVLGLRTLLAENGLVHNKHIPAAYLRASVAQRTALLRGLMDTDGCWNKARRDAVFATVDKALALQVEELLLSLGQRVNVAEALANGFGKEVTYYRVTFTPAGLQPFRLPRKAEQAAASTKPLTRARRRVIVAVEPGPDVETACIGVSSPTRTYLCGDQMIPTHNTGRNLDYGWQEIAIQLGTYAQGINTSGVWDRHAEEWHPNPLDGAKVRTDAGIVIHLPVDKESEKTPTVYGIDLESGWQAAVLCERVRAWRKVRSLASPVMVSEADTFAPSRTAAQTVRSAPMAGSYDPDTGVTSRTTVRPPTLKDRAQAVTSKGEASAVWKDAKKAGLPESEVDELVSVMQARLKVLAEPGG